MKSKQVNTNHVKYFVHPKVDTILDRTNQLIRQVWKILLSMRIAAWKQFLSAKHLVHIYTENLTFQGFLIIYELAVTIQLLQYVSHVRCEFQLWERYVSSFIDNVVPSCFRLPFIAIDHRKSNKINPRRSNQVTKENKVLDFSGLRCNGGSNLSEVEVTKEKVR